MYLCIEPKKFLFAIFWKTESSFPLPSKTLAYLFTYGRPLLVCSLTTKGLLALGCRSTGKDIVTILRPNTAIPLALKSLDYLCYSLRNFAYYCYLVPF